MCIECEYDPDPNDYNDEFEGEPDVSSVKNEEPQMTHEDKLEFIALLLADDEDAMMYAATLLAERKTPRITEANHTLWVRGQRDQNGMYVYHVTHNLGSENVLVSLDSTELFTYSVKDENVVVVVCPESLWGVDVNVRIND